MAMNSTVPGFAVWILRVSDEALAKPHVDQKPPGRSKTFWVYGIPRTICKRYPRKNVAVQDAGSQKKGSVHIDGVAECFNQFHGRLQHVDRPIGGAGRLSYDESGPSSEQGSHKRTERC